MRFEGIVMLEESITRSYANLTDCTNCIWRREIKEIKPIDEKHFIEYSLKDYPTFFTVLKKTKNKTYELEFSNNEMEGNIRYQFSKEEKKTKIEVFLDVQWVSERNHLLAKSRLKKHWKDFLRDLEKVGL